MPPKPRVYLLEPKKYSPETIAVTFAKTSRSPQSFDQIAEELTDEKSAEFHEKWVVGYGHASVAEHAVLHLAVENVSRLAVESLESTRLASYTEKSTRYQKWDANGFMVPPELYGHPLENLYQETCRSLFDAYLQSLEPVRQLVAIENPPQTGESEAAWERRNRSEYVDVCRFFLPAAALANVGMTINARALEHVISKMLVHPLQEVQQMGEDLKSVAQAEVPTLVKYAQPLPYLQGVSATLLDYASKLQPGEPVRESWCNLVSMDSEIENRLLAAALFRFCSLPYSDCYTHIMGLTSDQRLQLAEMVCGQPGKFDIPIRELEHSSLSCEVVLDQGAYGELKRHRMMTQTVQNLTPCEGYAIPRRITAAGLEKTYVAAMEQAAIAFNELAKYNPEVASYVIPNGYNRRVLLTMNFRSAHHLVRLRTAPNAHFSIRRIVARLADEIQQSAPVLGKLLGMQPLETWQTVEKDHFTNPIVKS